MLKRRTSIGLISALVFVAGLAVITYNGRPAARMARSAGAENGAKTGLSVRDDDDDDENDGDDDDGGAVTASGTPDSSVAAPAVSVKTGSYSLADVKAHGTRDDCWAAIDGGVYDLTTWISRHPGGPQRIITLCGTDGTDAYTRQHGRSGRAAAALVLLKIGTLN